MGFVRLGMVGVVVGFAGFNVAAPAGAALPRTYDVQRVESPNPQANGIFGQGLVGHSDLNGDGRDDMLVPQPGTGPNSDGQLFVMSGATGALLDTINAPDRGNPGNVTGNARAGFALFASSIKDLGSCPGGSAGADCAAPSRTQDGVDEIVAGAAGVDVPTPGAPGGVAEIGRAYVFDGRTRALLKRIDMPAADRLEQATFPAGPPNPHTPSFGRVVLSPAGLPPCAGNAGIGPCDGLPGPAAIGDVDGAFDSGPGDVDLADLVIGAPTYDETEASNPACDPGQCHEAGRSYVYRGEDVMDPANGGAATPLQTPLRTLKSVTAQTDDPTSSARTDSELFGQAIFPIGDVGSCNAATPAGDPCPNASSTATPDGSPEVVVSAFRTDLPSNADFPDPAFFDVGVNMLVDGKTGAVLAIYQHPEPQAGSIFGFTLHNEPAAGDLGSTPLADVFIPAMRQNVDFTAQGRGYVMNGNFKAGANGTNFAQVNDPTPQSGGNFGVSSAGIGNLVSDEAGAPRNELLVGAFGPHNPGTNPDIINDITIFNPVTERALQTITDPDQQPGSSFGTALAPMGDLNGDGFLDYAVGADLWDSNQTTGRSQGRVYLLRSDNSPAPPAPPAGDGAGAPGAPGAPGQPAAGAAVAGRAIELAANRTVVARGSSVRLSGAVEAFANQAACEGGQDIDVQARDTGATRYRTIARTRTDGQGNFTATIRPARTTSYRARVVQTPACLGAVSDAQVVAVPPRVGLVSRSARLSAGRVVSFQLLCPRGAICSGSVKLRTGAPVQRPGGPRRRITLGTSAFQIPGGGRRTTRLTVSSSTAAALRSRASVPVNVFITSRDRGGRALVSTGRLTLRTR